MSRPRLTLCMIVRDEATLLPDCLRSVQGVVDRVVVVDTGSTDGTAEVARAAGARVIEHAWQDDFAAARNAGLAAVRSGFVLVLDADERLAPGAGRVLRRALRKGGFDLGWLPLHDADAMDARPQDVLSGRARRGDPQWLPRLLRWTPDLAYRGCVHETVADWARERRTRRLAAPIVHLGAVPELREARGKSERNLRLLRRRAESEPEDAGVRAYLSRELERAGQDEEAHRIGAEAWGLVLKRRAAGDATVEALLPATVHAEQLLSAGALDAAAEMLDDARTLTEAHPNTLFLSGVRAEQAALGSADEAGALAEAADWYAACLADDAGARIGEALPGVTGWQARLRLATVKLRQGALEEARAAFERVLRERPEDPEALLGLAEATLDAGGAAAALAILEPLVAEGELDAWALAAECAAGLGASDDALLFATRVVELGATGAWRAPHRRVRFEGWHATQTAPAGAVRRNVLVWPRYEDDGELELLLREFGKTLAGRSDTQLFVVHDEAVDGSPERAVASLERAYAAHLPSDAPLEVVFWTDPMTPAFEQALADEVVCSVVLPASREGERAALLARIDAPQVADAAGLQAQLARAGE